jgi:hypothetical protein
MSMKNSEGIIGNQTHDLPAGSTVSQPTAPPCAPECYSTEPNLYEVVMDFYTFARCVAYFCVSDKHVEKKEKFI